jgi:hypothetical protein
VAARDIARNNHDWVDKQVDDANPKYQRTAGRLQAEIVSQYARPIAPGVVQGGVGTTRKFGFYGLFQETRQPFIRPAADATVPAIGERLAENLAKKFS